MPYDSPVRMPLLIRGLIAIGFAFDVFGGIAFLAFGRQGMIPVPGLSFSSLSAAADVGPVETGLYSVLPWTIGALQGDGTGGVSDPELKNTAGKARDCAQARDGEEAKRKMKCPAEMQSIGGHPMNRKIWPPEDCTFL